MEWMESYLQIWMIVCPLVFLAGFVDAVAGGGGLISLPAYTFAGIPIHLAAGTNKFAMSLGTGSAMLGFIKSGKVHMKTGIVAGLGALIGSPLGAKLQLLMPENVVSVMMLIVLPCVAIYTACNHKMGMGENNFTEPETFDLIFGLKTFAIGFFIGGYDGLIGPGTGTFLILCFSSILGFELIISSGCAKIVNFISNISALTIYLIEGKVMFAVGVPACICAVLGNQLGTRMAVRGGSKVVRYLVFVVLGMMIAKFIYELAV